MMVLGSAEAVVRCTLCQNSSHAWYISGCSFAVLTFDHSKLVLVKFRSNFPKSAIPPPGLSACWSFNQETPLLLFSISFPPPLVSKRTVSHRCQFRVIVGFFPRVCSGMTAGCSMDFPRDFNPDTRLSPARHGLSPPHHIQFESELQRLAERAQGLGMSVLHARVSEKLLLRRSMLL